MSELQEAASAAGQNQGRLGLTGRVDSKEVFFTLGAGPNVLGKDPLSHVVVDCEGVSRRHALVLVESKGVHVIDQRSKNGTFVNGQRVLNAAVEPGDEIWIGPTALQLVTIDSGDAELALELGPPAETRSPPCDQSTARISLAALPRVQEPPDRLCFPEGHVRGVSEAAAEMYAEMGWLAPGDLPVLIAGETGVGKEMLACAFHLSSPRAPAPFVAINCAAIPRELLEAELFGVGKAVATGVAPRPGKFALAEGGTLFLDEIGEMPAELQAKLLRALQEKEIQPVGGKPVKIDLRVVSATNADISECLENGSFRRDLYYRLAGFVLRVPPLRRRRADVPALVEHFLRRFGEEASKPVRGLTVAAMRALQAYPWPGNVRELEHEIRRLVYLCPPGQVVRSSMLSAEIRRTRPSPEAHGEPSTEPASSSADPLPTLNLAELEERAIREALQHSRRNHAAAARLLGISRFALRRRIERHAL